MICMFFWLERKICQARPAGFFVILDIGRYGSID